MDENPFLIYEITVGNKDYRIIQKGKDVVWEYVRGYDAMDSPSWEKCEPPALPNNYNSEEWNEVKNCCDAVLTLIEEQK